MTVIKGEHPDLWTHGKVTLNLDVPIKDITKALTASFTQADLAGIVIELLCDLDNEYCRQVKDWLALD